MTTVDTDVKFALPIASKLIFFFVCVMVVAEKSFKKSFGGENHGALWMVEGNFHLTEHFCVPSNISEE